MKIPTPIIPAGFDDPALERRFRAQFQRRHRLQNRMAAAFGLALYVLFSMVDFVVGGERWPEIVFIRLGLTFPILALVMAGLYVRRIMDRFMGPLVFTAMLLSGLSLAAMNTRLPPESENLFFPGLLIVILFGHVFFRTDFRWPSAATLLLFPVYLGMNFTLNPLPVEELIASTFYYLSAAFIMIYTGWLLERQERRTFLMEDRLRRQALTDALTGLPNRRAFFAHLAAEWRRALRARTRLSLLVVDLDYLKEINDTHGHAAGDAALRQLGQALSRQARRPGDLAARLGGDEFALLLSGGERERVLDIAQRIAAGFGVVPAKGSRPSLRLTASIGVVSAVPPPTHTPEDLLSVADAALYEAKAGGRARAVYRPLLGKWHQSASNAPAAPMPVPTHMVTMP